MTEQPQEVPAETPLVNGSRASSSGGQQRGWPDWDSNDLLGLVKYVSRAALDMGAFGPPGLYNNPDEKAARTILGEAYDVLASRRIPYGLSPWTPGARQRIRPSSEVIRTEGTCLDLAVLFASMCWSVQLRPLIAVGGETNRHAIVIVDLHQPLNMSRYPLPTPFSEFDRRGAPGLYYVSFPQVSGLSPRFLAVDLTEATVGGGQSGSAIADFDQALEAGARWLLHNQLSAEIVDPLHARGAGVPGTTELGAPDVALVPVIRTRLSMPPGHFREFESRAPLERELAAASETIVLRGESGMGKSMLAARRAAAADHGFGWILNASDAETLMLDLADAERTERDAIADPSTFDRVAYAEMALARLRGTRAPWVVVLDNANCEPSTLGDWVPTPGPGQTLIVTTTNAAWDGFRGGRTLQVTELHAGEVAADLPDWVQRLVGGNPHFALAMSKARTAGADFGADRPIAPSDLMWEAVEDMLGPGASKAALAMAWLPSCPVAAQTLSAVGVPEAASALTELADVGLVGLTGGGAGLMHRSFRQARRAPAGDRAALAVVEPILSEVRVRTLLVQHADAADLADLRRVLEAHAEHGSAWLGLARAIEYRGGQGGVQAAAELAASALGDSVIVDFPDAGLPLDPLDQADCWQLRARWIKDRISSSEDELAMAQDWMRQIRESWSASTDPQQALRASRADAMVGLILVRWARKLAEPDEKRQSLLEAADILQRSYEDRVRITELLVGRGEDVTDDRDRALFNLVRPYMELGKMSASAEAARYFSECSTIYQKCLEIRQDRFGRSTAIPMIASCKAGIGITQYNVACKALDEALSAAGPEGELSDADLDLVTAALRKATRVTIDALSDRVAFEGRHDGSDTVKSLDMLTKIAMLRSLVGTSDKAGNRLPARGEAARHKLTASLGGFVNEWTGTKDWELKLVAE